MVTRKPVGSGRSFSSSSAAGIASHSAAAPAVPAIPIVTAPTPTTPSALQAENPVLPSAPPLDTADLTSVNATLAHANTAPPVRPPEPLTDSEDDDEWGKSDSEDEWEMADKEDVKQSDPKFIPPAEIPAPLRISRPSSQQSNHNAKDVPAVLRVGPPGGVPQVSNESLVSSENNNPWRSASQSPPKRPLDNNPFLRSQNTGEVLFGSQNSSTVWGGNQMPSPAAPAVQPIGYVAELPAVNSPTEASGKPSANAFTLSSTSSQPPLIPVETEKEAVLNRDGKATDLSEAYKHLSVFDTLGSSTVSRTPSNEHVGAQQIWQGQHGISEGKQKERSLIDLPHGQEPESSASPEAIPPPKPPRPEADTSATSPDSIMRNQRNQTYQIKKVRWFDERVRELRVSPILTQNANGPCPLLALVNALTMSTPNGLDTGLVETLRTREQVSLGLLLDAVFEELMSGRHGDGIQELPDVGELYSFLIALHTGMNVNPQFTLDPALPQLGQPGGFERTKEMRLYSTFSIPLIHGWLPERDSEAYAAFDRSAKTYEDAQNIQFYEEELESKLGSTGLTTDEQHLFEDLIAIKQFLETWPTQLTDHGLMTIRNHLRPGQFAILFRNDHFSTVYKEPKSNSLVTVVTDAGYSSHDEIVWESLVDINGMRTEHFSGDFRPVSHSQPVQIGPSAGSRDSSLASRSVQNMLDTDQGWTEVQGRSNKKRGKNASTSSQQTGIIGSSSSALSRTEQRSSETGMSRSEQEDADLALALQLQEEEEDRQRRAESERRNRQLSAQVLDQGATSNPIPISRPAVPPRRGNQHNFTTNRPAPAAGEDAPPPSYEDASKDRRFNPPHDHPASPHAPVNSGHTRQQSAYMQNASAVGAGRGGAVYGGPSNTGVRRPSRPGQQPGGPLIDRIPDRLPGRRVSGASPVGGPPGNRDEKCVVM